MKRKNRITKSVEWTNGPVRPKSLSQPTNPALKVLFAGLFGVLVIAMVCLALAPFGLIAWNETTAVRQVRAADEIGEVAIADVSPSRVLPENEGAVVHIKGTAETDDLVRNQFFELEENAIRISWDSSIYQLVETKRTRDNDTTYRYEREWVDELVDSSEFRSNRESNQGSKKTFPSDGISQAETVSLGAFTLSPELVDQIDNDEPLRLTSIPQAYAATGGAIVDGVFWTGDPESPELGDQRIEFWIARPGVDVTLIAQQNRDTFVPYVTPSGQAKEVLYVGLLNKDEMIRRQSGEGQGRRLGLRLVSFPAMWLGLRSPLGVWLTRKVPIFNNGAAMPTIFSSVAFSAIITLVFVALFWLVVRPLFAASLITAAALICGVSLLVARQKKRRAQSERVEKIAAADSGKSARIEGYKILRSDEGPQQIDAEVQDSIINEASPEVFKQNPPDQMDR